MLGSGTRRASAARGVTSIVVVARVSSVAPSITRRVSAGDGPTGASRGTRNVTGTVACPSTCRVRVRVTGVQPSGLSTVNSYVPSPWIS